MNSRFKLLFIIPFIFSLSSCSEEQKTTPEIQKFTGDLPISSRIKVGTFSNGMTYIIRRNPIPEARSELRLVIKAGSVLEDDNQQGFAHFVEHMAFNGTKDFEKQDIVEYVESIGMKFGAHLNAYTSFDETVYMLQIPTDDMKIFETGIHIMENWAHKLSFDAVEIDKERGVVIEEWRGRLGAGSRLSDKQLPIILKDSQYAVRLPIGKHEILEKGKHEDLIRFYKDWYRPNLMAVIAVGDFDPEEVEVLLKKYFEKIPAHKPPKERTRFKIPANDQMLFSIETDPELTAIRAAILIKHQGETATTYAAYRKDLIKQLYIGMLNGRFGELALADNPPFVGAGSSYGKFLAGSSAFNLSATAKKNQTLASLKSLLEEANRTIQHGFTAGELARQKKTILARGKKMAKEIDTTSSGIYAREYVSYFLNTDSISGMDHYAEIEKHFLPTITLEEVNRIGAQLLTQKNRVITISAPDAEKDNLPKPETIQALWDEVSKTKLSAYEDTAVASSLMAEVPAAGSITDRRFDKKLGAHYWTLSNGAKVILKPTDFKKDQILFSAFSLGGRSLLDDDKLAQTAMASAVINYAGIGDFDQIALKKFTQGKTIRLSSSISNRGEALNGLTAPANIKDFMEMLHLKFTAPRKDQKSFTSLMSRFAPMLENRFKQPAAVFSEAIRKAKYGNNPRYPRVDVAYLKAIELDAAYNFYKKRFANAADFTFIFVGNIDLEKMEELTTSYIATLPASKIRETWKKRADARATGKINVTVNMGLEKKARVTMQMFGTAKWSVENSIDFHAMKSALTAVLREKLREDKGGVYGVGVRGSFHHTPRQQYSLTISFGCDPTRVEELITEVENTFAEFKAGLIDKKYIKNYIQQTLKSRQVSLKNNSFWLKRLRSEKLYGSIILALDDYEDAINKVSASRVLKASKLYLSSENKLIGKLLPEEK